jgi:hypothetical protein
VVFFPAPRLLEVSRHGAIAPVACRTARVQLLRELMEVTDDGAQTVAFRFPDAMSMTWPVAASPVG